MLDSACMPGAAAPQQPSRPTVEAACSLRPSMATGAGPPPVGTGHRAPETFGEKSGSASAVDRGARPLSAPVARALLREVNAAGSVAGPRLQRLEATAAAAWNSPRPPGPLSAARMRARPSPRVNYRQWSPTRRATLHAAPLSPLLRATGEYRACQAASADAPCGRAALMGRARAAAIKHGAKAPWKAGLHPHADHLS